MCACTELKNTVSSNFTGSQTFTAACVTHSASAVYFAYAVFGLCGAIFIACLAMGIYFKLTKPSTPPRAHLDGEAQKNAWAKA